MALFICIFFLTDTRAASPSISKLLDELDTLLPSLSEYGSSLMEVDIDSLIPSLTDYGSSMMEATEGKFHVLNLCMLKKNYFFSIDERCGTDDVHSPTDILLPADTTVASRRSSINSLLEFLFE